MMDHTEIHLILSTANSHKKLIAKQCRQNKTNYVKMMFPIDLEDGEVDYICAHTYSVKRFFFWWKIRTIVIEQTTVDEYLDFVNSCK